MILVADYLSKAERSEVARHELREGQRRMPSELRDGPAHKFAERTMNPRLRKTAYEKIKRKRQKRLSEQKKRLQKLGKPKS